MVAKLDPMTPQVAVLGSLLIEPSLTGEVMTKLRAEDFSNERCRIIFQCIQSLFMEGKPVDPAVVAGRLSAIPGIGADLMDIMRQTPTAANIWAYVDILKEQSRMTQLRTYAMRLLEADNLEDAHALMAKANGVFSDRPGISRLSAGAMLADFRNRHQAGRHPDYLTWSLPKLDEQCYTEPGDFVILGGYPSAGKTALALRFAWHMAQTRRVAFYSLETGTSKLADRSVAALAGIDMRAIKRSALTAEHWGQVDAQEKSISECSLDMIRAGGMTVQDIQADALAHRYEVVFIDYVQLIAVPKAYNRTEIVTSISLGLHQMAQANNITVVALSQLHRAETQKNGAETAPRMSSLRESGQLEQDADTIMLLYRENPDDMFSRRVLKVAKNKEGTIGLIYLDFDGKTQTFSESSQSREVMEHLQYEGRKAKRTAYQQSTFTDITDDPDDELPF